MKNLYGASIAVFALAGTCTLTAESVYKSVDSQGNVTYSSFPPTDAREEMVEEVPIAPGPTEQQEREAQQRIKGLERESQRAEQERREETTQRSKSASDAERALRDAKISLQEARIQGDDDWQYLAGRGRALKQSYFDRVKDAERKVQEAEKALRGARSGTR